MDGSLIYPRWLNDQAKWWIAGVEMYPGGGNKCIYSGGGNGVPPNYPGPPTVTPVPNCRNFWIVLSHGSNIVFDRDYIHGIDGLGTDLTNNLGRRDVNKGMMLGASPAGIPAAHHIAVINSYISQIHDASTQGDTTGIAVIAMAGPSKINNNYISSTGELFMSGGGLYPIVDAATDKFIHDIEFQHNYLEPDPAWLPYSFVNPSTWLIKTLWECKDGDRMLINGNIMHGAWAGGFNGKGVAEQGQAIRITPRQGIGRGGAVCNNIAFVNNLVLETNVGVAWISRDGDCGAGAFNPNCRNPGTSRRIWYVNNVFTGRNRTTQNGCMSCPSCVQGNGAPAGTVCNGFNPGGNSTGAVLQSNWGIADSLFSHNTAYHVTIPPGNPPVGQVGGASFSPQCTATQGGSGAMNCNGGLNITLYNGGTGYHINDTGTLGAPCATAAPNGPVKFTVTQIDTNTPPLGIVVRARVSIPAGLNSCTGVPISPWGAPQDPAGIASTTNDPSTNNGTGLQLYVWQSPASTNFWVTNNVMPMEIRGISNWSGTTAANNVCNRYFQLPSTAPNDCLHRISGNIMGTGGWPPATWTGVPLIKVITTTVGHPPVKFRNPTDCITAPCDYSYDPTDPKNAAVPGLSDYRGTDNQLPGVNNSVLQAAIANVLTGTLIPAGSHTISGSLSGLTTAATITLGGAATATTTGTASYSFTNLANGSYTVTPTLTNCSFNPTNQSATINNAGVSGINFAATCVTTWSISGTVAGVAAVGSTVTLSGAVNQTTTTSSTGTYTFTNLANGSYTVRPGHVACTFIPVNQAVTLASANATANFTSTCAARPPTQSEEH